MSSSKLTTLMAVALIGFTVNLQAQTITQDAFLDDLIQSHPLVQKEQLTAQIESERRAAFLGAEDWRVHSSLTLSHLEPAVAFAGPEKTDAIAAGGGIERLFWKTGGRFSASFSTYRATVDIDPAFQFPSTFYQNEIAVGYTHPLMRNKRGFLDRLGYDLKQFDIDFSEVQAVEEIEAFLTNSASKFLDWSFLSERKTIIAERLKLSEEELARTHKKREANLIDQADVIRAEDAVRIWKQALVLAESSWRALQAELAVLSQNDRLYELSPEFDLYQNVNSPSLEEATLRLKQDSRLIALLNIRLEQLGLTRLGFEEAIKPDLSLIAQLNTKKLDGSYGQSLGMDKPDATVGLRLSFPLGNHTAKSQISRTDLQAMQLQKQIDILTLSLTSAYTSLHIQISELETVLELNRLQIQSAKDRTEEELKLYNQGRGELTFVIQSRDNEQNAKLTYAVNALSYHKLLLQSRELTDQLYQ